MQKLAAVQSEDFNPTKGDPAIAPASRSRARCPLGLDHPGRRLKAQLLSQAMLNFTIAARSIAASFHCTA